MDISIKPKVFYPPNMPDIFNVIFELRIRSEHFDLQVICVGNFQVSGEVPEHTKKDFANLNAPAIVFPYLRAFVTNLSGSLGGVIPVFVLPPQFFVGQIEELKPDSPLPELVK